MWKVDWAPTSFTVIVSRYFHTEKAARGFIRSSGPQVITVLTDPDGNRMED